MSAKTFKIAVVGASGYAGAEATRLICGHPRLVPGDLVAHSSAGRRAADVLPHLASSLGDQHLREPDPRRLAAHDGVVLALPHGASAELADQLVGINPDLVIVDAGADFRLASGRDWQQWYGGEHAGTWTYGLPELVLADGTRQRDLIRQARHIAGPGCNASAVTLALAPLVGEGLVESEGLSAVLAVGTSGAGRKARAEMIFAETSGGARPYATGSAHRHVPEILQSLRWAGAGASASLTMTPVLVPMSRGILAVCTARAEGSVDTGQVREAIGQAYRDEAFITVLPRGEFASTHPVLGSNNVLISADVDPDSGLVTVAAALDNLVKGTAGAVVQCLNLALGMAESAGLPRTGLAP